MATQREENVYMAKLAEQAERYEEMVEFMEKVSESIGDSEELTVDRAEGGEPLSCRCLNLSISVPFSMDGGGGGGGFTSPRSEGFPAGLRVLVVDDDLAWLRILEKMLKKCSYEVSWNQRC